jgi:hypothetical protein
LLENTPRTLLIQGRQSMARMRARPRELSGQCGTGTLASMATSGWVIKKAVGIKVSLPQHGDISLVFQVSDDCSADRPAWSAKRIA